MGRRAKSAKGKTEAKRRPGRQAPKKEAARVHELEERLAQALEREQATGALLQEKNRALADAHAQTTQALEQQTATSAILGIISSSRTDVQPVFDAIVRSAVRLCDGLFGTLWQFDGELIHQVAQHNYTPEALEEARRVYPSRPGRGHGSARAILERTVVHIPDRELDPEFRLHGLSSLVGWRSGLFVPMLRGGAPIGAIAVTRVAPGRFSDNEIELLKTFADQAVIAVENVRLFTELQEKNRAFREANAHVTEALEHQTATAEILRVISQSPTDVQPVFDTIARNAVRLCGGVYSTLYRVEGALIHFVGHHNFTPDQLDTWRRTFPRPVEGTGVPVQRVVRTGTVYRIGDPEAQDDTDTDALTRAGQRARGLQSLLIVPMFRQHEVIGAIGVTHRERNAFTDAHVELLKTFADQAVIAIENVRLFTELQASNRELTTALEQQTATSQILQVISQSPTDVQPVFDVIAQSAARLCEGYFSVVFVSDGAQLHVAATHNLPRGWLQDATRSFPAPLTGDTQVARAVRERCLVHVADMQEDTEVSAGSRRRAEISGYRTWIAIPMLGTGGSVGAIAVSRRERKPFSDSEVLLLKTFADQAVIAIENVRLFTELQEKNRALTEVHARVSEALEQQTATSEVLKVISRSAFDLQPVLDTLIENATRLAGAEGGLLGRFDGEVFRILSGYGATPEVREYWQRNVIRPGRGAPIGRAALERQTVHIVDLLADPEYELHEAQRVHGGRSVLVVPMLRQDDVLGVFFMYRTEVRAFTDKQIDLVATFADQAVIAIENARLLGELRARTGELTRSVEELTALGEVSRALSSTLDLETVLQTIVDRAVQLSYGNGGTILEYDEATEEFQLRVSTEGEDAVAALRETGLRKGEGAVGRMAVTREPVQIPDIAVTGAYESRVRDALLQSGRRAVLALPLQRDERLIGGLVISRNIAGDFPLEVIELLKTFATQSALAIQNARLFREIEEKSRELEAASRHKSEFLANMSHELRTPLNAVIGFSEVLADGLFGEVNEKQSEYLNDILESGRHLLSLINDILDLSKIEAGRMELDSDTFDLPGAIDNALTLIRERASRRGVRLDHAVDPRLTTVQADERKVKQVLLNLLSNALKFTPEGGHVTVRARRIEELAEISVIDTGVGIAPEDQETVFEEFRQVGTASKRVEGTGLGLALCRKFVELHGGRIWVKSELGAGSSFTFTIPVQRPRA